MADTELVLFQDGTNVIHQRAHDMGDGVYSLVRVDEATWATTTITYEHHEIHAGNHYFVTGTTTLASDGQISFGITTSDSTEWAHLTFGVDATGQTTLDFYESATYTGGSAVTAYNNNRNSTNTSGLTIVSDPTFATSDGTLISARAFGIEANPAQIFGGTTTRDREMILKQNTKYVVIIGSGSAGNIISYDAEWYEHTHKA
jgi:hypothetical protein